MSGPPSNSSLPDEPHYGVRNFHPPKRRFWLHILLFVLTILTTLVVGARLQQNFVDGQNTFLADESFFPLRWILAGPHRLFMGIPFAATLLGILLAHEMGHFIYSVKHRVYATLPFFLPVPSPIGTFGAFIKIMSPFRTRAALLDIGIAGPIAGFVVAVPAAVIGLALSQRVGPDFDPATQLGNPLVFHALHWAMRSMSLGAASQIPLQLTAFHPVALAAWVGMLATAFNLLPGGQLDGGHIIFAWDAKSHRTITFAAMLALVPLAIFCWAGWLIWIVGLFVTRRHPAVPEWPELGIGRRKLLLIAAAMLVLTFIPTPVPQGSLLEAIREFRL